MDDEAYYEILRSIVEAQTINNTEEYGTHSKFDVHKHKEHFVNWCETCITSDGEIHYAVPGHNQFMEMLGASQNSTTVHDFIYRCPESMYFDYRTWLMDSTSTVCTFLDGYVRPRNITLEQRCALDLLIDNGLCAENIF